MKIEEKRRYDMTKQYYLNHRELICAKQRLRYKAEKNKILEQGRKYRLTNKYKNRCKQYRSTVKYKEKRRIWDLNWRKRHPDYGKLRYRNNIERFRQQHLDYYRRKKKDILAKCKLWKQSEKGRLAIKKMNFLRKDAGYINIEIIKKIIEKDKGICQYCFKKCRISGNFNHPLYLTIDHKIPISRCKEFGLKNIHNEKNLVVACSRCNMKKKTKTDWEFREYLKKETIKGTFQGKKEVLLN